MWTLAWSLPNLVLFGLLFVVIWYKLRLLRMDLVGTIGAEFEKERARLPAPDLGTQFVAEGFDNLRQDLRELTVRVEHVEVLLKPPPAA